MPREFHRSQRVGEEIHRSLSDIVRLRLKDPRLEKVTFTEVRVSRDLSHARVFYSCLQPDMDRDLLQQALSEGAGQIRSLLSRDMRLRRVPELHFEFDVSLERAEHVTRLIDDAIARDKASADES
jgi:ribosome-binding factor A